MDNPMDLFDYDDFMEQKYKTEPEREDEGLRRMTLSEYAALSPAKELTETERKIMELEGQLWESDYRNDPAWVLRENKRHNAEILRKIEELERMEAAKNE